MPSMMAICLRKRCVCCEALQQVSFPSLYSATAHDGPIEPCVWMAKSYVAEMVFAPGVFNASAVFPTFCRSSSLAILVLRTYSHSFAFSGKPCQSDQVV